MLCFNVLGENEFQDTENCLWHKILHEKALQNSLSRMTFMKL